jgi:hypothetical protein
MLRKSSAAIVAFVAVGSALFGGAALANGGHNGGHNGGDDNTGGAGGAGGAATTYCVNSASQVPFQNTYDDFNASGIFQVNDCDATGGAGGDGGAGEIDLD